MIYRKENRIENKRKIGSNYETIAIKYLESQGIKVIEQNYRTAGGEIDIIAKDGKYLVFIEVKYRRSSIRGNALEAVNYKKQSQIKKMAIEYLYKKISHGISARFDVVGINGDKITWIKNAF